MDENNVKETVDETLKDVAEKELPKNGKKTARKKKGWKQELREWVVALVSAVLIVVVIQSFLFRIIRVDGHSMDETLADGERLFVTVTDVKFGDVDRGDVVICHYPDRWHDWFNLGILKTREYFV